MKMELKQGQYDPVEEVTGIIQLDFNISERAMGSNIYAGLVKIQTSIIYDSGETELIEDTVFAQCTIAAKMTP